MAKDPSVFERAGIWLVGGGVMAAIAIIPMTFGLSERVAPASIWRNGWVRLGFGMAAIGVLAVLWSVVLFLAHHHTERLLALAQVGVKESQRELETATHERDKLAEECSRYRTQISALELEISSMQANALETERPITQKVFVGTTITISMLIRMLTDAERGNNRLVGYEFTDCVFTGPAMTAFPGSTMDLCIWVQPKAIAIEPVADLTGAFSFVSCQFLRCRFVAITALVPADQMDRWGAMFTS